MTGTIKLTISIVVLLLAAMAILLVFGIIPAEFFGEATAKILLTAAIVGLAAAALTFIMRFGK